MKLTGLHVLLTYQCNLECDHCFVWGSPWQSGTMTLQNVRQILHQAKELGTVEWIYFEGGEPFLYYATLVRGVQEASKMGFRAGIVENPPCPPLAGGWGVVARGRAAEKLAGRATQQPSLPRGPDQLYSLLVGGSQEQMSKFVLNSKEEP